MSEEKMREALEQIANAGIHDTDHAMNTKHLMAAAALARTALSTKQEGGEVSRSQTAAPFDQATQEPAASHAAIFVLFVAKQFEEFCDDPMEGWQEMAEAFGIVEQVEFDPAKHQDPHGMFTEGDTMFVLTEQAKHAIHAARDGAVANASERVATPLPAPDAGWRTIDSAPKDGTHILLRWGATVTEGYYAIIATGTKGEPWWRTFAAGVMREQVPTDWLPLPAPPVGDGSAPAKSGPV